MPAISDAPWTVRPLGDGGIVETADGIQFGRCVSTHAVNMSSYHADMIAAVPELLAALKQVRDFYLNADSAWRFSEGFDIDTVCRAIAKAEGEPYPPFEGTDVMDGDEDRP